MRTRHLSRIVLLFLFSVTGASYREGDITAATTALAAQQPVAEPLVPLPNRAGSFKFGVLGDFGTGS